MARFTPTTRRSRTRSSPATRGPSRPPSRCCTSPRSRTATSPTTPWSTSPNSSGHPAEVLGTCSFYEMFKRHEVGKYLVNVCTNISCQLHGRRGAARHAEPSWASRPAAPPPTDVHHRGRRVHRRLHRGPRLPGQLPLLPRAHPAEVPALVRDLREGAYSDKIPQHGVLAFERQHLPAASVAAIRPPEQAVQPEWFARRQAPAPAAEGAK
jgi:hypothetical protein